ncbi:hypothetical protein CWI80_09225 [Pseudidiomarina sediminum]|uniref:GPP34 family phosphoprotein n=1 Tax=Pseudidiomarina sediminum TaxID=431675 RepID=A0A432Z4E5_9GAMM|nr:GPP34 family phosphoprotein [Pseudidiomarina sediminum]RUO72713.1 hypothetical protein CWI80_09225 [Pseudidiomarina sediminum]
MSELRLYEGLMLLALSEEKGTIEGAYIEYGVAAAMLAELLLLKKLTLTNERTPKVQVSDTAVIGDDVLDEGLQKIAQSKRPRKLKDWVTKLAQVADLKHKVAAALVRDGVVALEEKKILWLFTQKVYPELNPEPEQALRRALRDLVLEQPLEVNPRQVLLLALAQSARLLPQVFSKAELKTHKKRIEELVKGEQLGVITKDVIAAVEVAMMVAVMLPAMTAATSAATASSVSSSSC